MLKLDKLEVVDSYEEYFNIQDASNIFTSVCGDDYFKYLSEDKVIVGLVKGKSSLALTRNIKYELRERFSCSNNMRNLLHTSDNPLEYRRQFLRLFPGKNYMEYQLEADLHVNWSKNNIEHLLTSTNISTIGIIFQNFKFESLHRNVSEIAENFKKIYVGLKLHIPYKDIDLGVIAYFQNGKYTSIARDCSFMNLDTFVCWAHEKGAIVIIDYLPFDIYSRKFVLELKEKGVDGFKIYDNRYDLKMQEFLTYLVKYKYKMIYTGGSNELENSGSLSIDQEIVANFEKEFKKYGYFR